MADLHGTVSFNTARGCDMSQVSKTYFKMPRHVSEQNSCRVKALPFFFQLQLCITACQAILYKRRKIISVYHKRACGIFCQMNVNCYHNCKPTLRLIRKTGTGIS